MLDVYRKYYGFTGEPFRLGPDYRFSLHHESYASAKAYLEYAIYQGEGFITITGEPGTGKTTLISEILAGLDREKVQVATLTSTQLESRDLIYMVASSFDLHPEDVSKANLLVEIETFLVDKIRQGQRAILIVDEAQGLSKDALEELRLLANLQYQYQLLLQVFLVGQEQLLELIRAPEMEHLHQRLVAATSLMPLSFDETVDYIEHRLSKVAWKGIPEIDEAALSEIYRYSGGIPRKINLIANRLFLYGGMEEKDRFSGDDARNVIQGLIGEFLLSSEPQVAEADLVSALENNRGKRSRALPRDERESGSAPASSGTEQGTKADTTSSESLSASRSEKPVEKKAVASSANKKNLQNNEFTAKAKTRGHARKPSSPAPVSRKQAASMERPVPPRSTPGPLQKTGKKHGGKAFFLVVFLLAGVGVPYLLREQAGDQGQVYKPVEPGVLPERRLSPQAEPEADTGVEQAPDLAPEHKDSGIAVKSAEQPETSERGEIIRVQSSESIEPVAEPETGSAESPSSLTAPLAVEEKVEPVLAVGPKTRSQLLETTAEPPAIVAVPALPPKADNPEKIDRIEPPVAVEKHLDEDEKPALKEPAGPVKAVESLAKADTKTGLPVPKPESTAIEAERSRLREAAKQRFSARQARGKPKMAQTDAVKTQEQPAKIPAEATTKIAAVSKPAPVEKAPQLTSGEIVSRLLAGRWNSGGKPASLLPSESTFCEERAGKISCQSVPKNIKTRYGLALYKVETTLSGFSEQGHFEMSYRTLVKLAGDGAAEGDGGKSADWQKNDYSMSCKLTGTDHVSCLDGKGVKRVYRRGRN